MPATPRGARAPRTSKLFEDDDIRRWERRDHGERDELASGVCVHPFNCGACVRFGVKCVGHGGHCLNELWVSNPFEFIDIFTNSFYENKSR